MKLAAFRPRFLLESVEGGERLARYSFIGFGDGLEVRARRRRPRTSAASGAPVPRDAAELLDGAARGAGARAADRSRRSPACRWPADWSATPPTMWCVLRAAAARAATAGGVPALHYVAPRSLLVFDHLTRGIALLHAGTEAERRVAARGSHAARCAGPARRPRGPAATRRPLPPSTPRTTTWPACSAPRNTSPPAMSISWCSPARFGGRHELDPFQAYRALRLINPSPYMYYCALGDITVVGSSPEALVKLNARPRAAAAHRRHPPALGGCRPSMRRARPNCCADPKENAEHVMLVDLARNDLGRVARGRQRARGSVSRASSATVTSCTW